MSVSLGLNSGLNGIQTGMQTMHKHALNLASADTMRGEGRESLAESVVGLKAGKHQVQASIAVVKTMDEVLGTLLDVEA